MRLILASTSPYRRELLQRLRPRLPFETARPQVDETPLADEEPAALARRLARAKATAVANTAPAAWVIGSDQVAELDGAPLGKPGGRGAALEQLASMSGRAIHFHTAVALVRNDEPALAAVDLTTVRFRRLDAAEIERYVDAEQPHLSQQLGVLRRAGFVTPRRDGTTVIYRLADERISDLLAVSREILVDMLTATRNELRLS